MTYQEQVREGKNLLKKWYTQYSMPDTTGFVNARNDTTVVIYHFGEKEVIDGNFLPIKCSILETWKHCGILKTNIITNLVTPTVVKFAEKYSPFVSITISNTLIPGDICSMSIDCNRNLFRYFDSDYALIVQNDGFPLHAGLERFIGKYDYIGAPFIRHNFLTKITGLAKNFAVGNGGFSLRSKRICEQAAFYWDKKYSKFLSPQSRFTKEDAFYCCVLPILERPYRKSIRFAPTSEAMKFSFDALYDEKPTEIPFGFHGSATFYWLKQNYSEQLQATFSNL